MLVKGRASRRKWYKRVLKLTAESITAGKDPGDSFQEAILQVDRRVEYLKAWRVLARGRAQHKEQVKAAEYLWSSVPTT